MTCPRGSGAPGWHGWHSHWRCGRCQLQGPVSILAAHGSAAQQRLCESPSATTIAEMDAVDEYLGRLADTAQRFVEHGLTAMDIMSRGAKTTAVPDLVCLRVQFLAPQDHARARGFLSSGCFGEMTGEERIAAFVVCFELEDEISKLDVLRRFRRYEADQPLFERCSELWPHVREAELMPTTHARHLRRSGLVEVPGGWGRLDPLLPPELLRWAERAFPGVPMFVRLDPWFAEIKQPTEPLREAAVRPARPGWWNMLGLRNRERDGGHYVLQERAEPSSETIDEFYEYHVRGIRSLEVHAKRSTCGNLAMMIEELADDRRPDGRLIGRCIHMDTDAAAGMDGRSAPLNHLDLAINMYFGQAASRRKDMRLCDGVVEDASVRTHLLRVEGIPFAASAEFARQFFLSTVLLSEWMRDQFGWVAAHEEPG